MKDSLPLGLDIAPLTPARADNFALLPDTEVLCINRGPEALEDMFDSTPFLIPAGYFRVQYAGARHFQARQIVPGSRNPEMKTVQSFIGIIGIIRENAEGIEVLRRVDPVENCQPFTADECAAMSLKVEGLDREHMLGARVPAGLASVVNVNEVRSVMEGAGAVVTRSGGRIVSDVGALEAPDPASHEGIQQAAVDRAEANAARAGDAQTPAPKAKRGRN